MITLADCSVGDNVHIPTLSGTMRITSRLTHACLLRCVRDDGRTDDRLGPWALLNDTPVTFREKAPSTRTAAKDARGFDGTHDGGVAQRDDGELWKGCGA